LKLDAGGDVSVGGNNVSIKAQVGATVEGSATATLKATSVKVAGKIDFAPA
jgi:hypothetical protein